MNELALFAGAGLGLLASRLLGHRIVCYVERDPYCVEVLKARIRDGYLDDAPIWDDVRTFDGRPWCGVVDKISAGFPCQPFAEGGKRGGASDGRNAWPDTIRIIREVKPRWVFLENSPKLLSPFRQTGLPAYFGTVVGDLAESGYVGQWGCLSASTLGASHKRERIWVVAHTSAEGRPFVLRGLSPHINEDSQEAFRRWESNPLDALRHNFSRLEKRLGELSVFGANDGTPHRVDRLGAIGQGQVPIVAKAAWELMAALELV